MFAKQFLELLSSVGEFEMEKLKLSLEHLHTNNLPLFFTSDSRTIKPNSVFVAIKGKNNDGHHYVNESFKNGAILSIVDHTGDYHGLCLKVDDTIAFINQMASRLFADYSGYTIAITGSNGKTTTKEWVKNLLLHFHEEQTLFSNLGNMNTEIGLPLCILNSLSRENKTSVIEMGMSKIGDIEFLVDTYKPDFPVVLNIGTAHIGNTGSLENTCQEKLKILKYHKSEERFCINCSDPFLRQYLKKNTKRQSAVLFGDRKDKQEGYSGLYLNNHHYSCQGLTFSTEAEMTLSYQNEDRVINKSFEGILHKGQLLNLCASLAIVSSLGYEIDSLLDLNSFIKQVKDRFEPVFKEGHLIFKDCYNSSLESLVYALDTLKQMRDDKHYHKIFCVLGPISETGLYREEIQVKIGEMLQQTNVDEVFFYTAEQRVKNIQKEYKGEIFFSDNKEEIATEVIDRLKKEKKALFLFKASRSIQLEEVYDHVMDAVD